MKKEIIKALKSKRKLYGYVKWSDNDGGYFTLIKSDFLQFINQLPEDSDFSNIVINPASIYVN